MRHDHLRTINRNMLHTANLTAISSGETTAHSKHRERERERHFTIHIWQWKLKQKKDELQTLDCIGKRLESNEATTGVEMVAKCFDKVGVCCGFYNQHYPWKWWTSSAYFFAMSQVWSFIPRIFLSRPIFLCNFHCSY